MSADTTLQSHQYRRIVLVQTMKNENELTEIKEKITSANAKRTKQSKRRDPDKMQKGEKDTHLTKRGIIMQLFSGVIIGLQAVRFFTD